MEALPGIVYFPAPEHGSSSAMTDHISHLLHEQETPSAAKVETTNTSWQGAQPFVIEPLDGRNHQYWEQGQDNQRSQYNNTCNGPSSNNELMKSEAKDDLRSCRIDAVRYTKKEQSGQWQSCSVSEQYSEAKTDMFDKDLPVKVDTAPTPVSLYMRTSTAASPKDMISSCVSMSGTTTTTVTSHSKPDHLKSVCPECYSTFDSDAELEIHMLIHGTYQEIQCFHCCNSFATKHDLLYHMRLVHNHPAEDTPAAPSRTPVHQQAPLVLPSVSSSRVSQFVPQYQNSQGYNNMSVPKPRGRPRGATKKKGRKRDPNRPQRPVNAYFFFIKEQRNKLYKEGNRTDTAVAHWTKEMAATWRSLSEDEKMPYNKLAADDRVRFDREISAYKHKDPNKPKRPQSAYFLWLGEFRKRNKEKFNENKHLLQAAGKEWQTLTHEDKEPFEAQAEKERARYQNEMRDYLANRNPKTFAEFYPQKAGVPMKVDNNAAEDGNDSDIILVEED